MSSIQSDAYPAARRAFIQQWGVMGSQWGVSRTMAQIHALLLVSRDPLCADDVMRELAISRGNAHTNLRELSQWGLVRRVLKRGDRKEYFEAEKDLWKMFTLIAGVRKQREIDPALAAVRQFATETKDADSQDGQAFHAQMNDLYRFLTSASSTLDRIVAAPHPSAMPWLFQPTPPGDAAG